MPSIVFSFWKSTLDLASSALTQAGITCLQVDGNVQAKQRGEILQRFSELETEAILLMSLSCGAVGYVQDSMIHTMITGTYMYSRQTHSYCGKPCVFDGAAMESSD